MKRLSPLAALTAPVIVALLFTAVSGSIFGLRQPPSRLPVEAARADVTRGFIDITVRNNELYRMSAEAWYALIDPQTGGVVYTSETVAVPFLAPRTNIVVSVPIPDGYDPAAYRITAGAREIVAYLSRAAEPRMILEGGLLPSVSDMRIRAASLTPLDGGLYRVQANLQLLAERAGDYRYALSLIPMTETEEGDLVPGAEAFRSAFTPLTLMANEPRTESVTAQAALTPGRYTLALWIQIASGDGGYEHFEQVIYPRLLDVE
jgi:hypothetical protein